MIYDSSNLLFQLAFFVTFFGVLGLLGALAINGLSHWEPHKKVSCSATVVKKRQTASAEKKRYFVTFEMDNGERLELHANEQQYELTAEQDRGLLLFKGKYLLSFACNRRF